MRYALRWWYISKLLDYGDLRKRDSSQVVWVSSDLFFCTQGSRESYFVVGRDY